MVCGRVGGARRRLCYIARHTTCSRDVRDTRHMIHEERHESSSAIPILLDFFHNVPLADDVRCELDARVDLMSCRHFRPATELFAYDGTRPSVSHLPS